MAKLKQLAGLALAVVGAGAWTQPAIAGSDLWWHLASGRDIWARGAVPLTDFYSFTAAGDRWLNHEWLWDVLYWGVYTLHPQAVAWGQFALVLAVFGVAYDVARRESGSIAAAVLCTWGAAAASHWFIDIRPHVWTLLFVGIVLGTRDWKHAPWMWPPLMLVWANLHGGFVFGLGAMGLIAVVRTAELSFGARRIVLPWRLWIGVTFAILAMLITPFGYQQLEYPLAYLDSSSPFRGIIEWQRTPLSLNPAGFDGRFWWLALVAGLGAVLSARRAPYPVALAVVAFAMAWTSRRFIPLFGITAAPLAATAVALGLQRARAAWPVLAGTRTEAIGLAVGLLAVLGMWRDVRITPDLLARWTQSDLYPSAALRYLQAIRDETGYPQRVLNYYNWGGFLMLHAPDLRLFIDGRANTIYSDETYLTYVAIIGAQPGLNARLARYRPEVALIPAGRFAQALQELDPPWRLVYADAQASLLFPPDSPALARPIPEALPLLADEPQFTVALSRNALQRGQHDEALKLARTASEQDPYSVVARGQILNVFAVSRDRPGVRRELERALRDLPRRKSELLQMGVGAYRILGDRDGALDLLRRHPPRGPFQAGAGPEQQIEAIERGTTRR